MENRNVMDVSRDLDADVMEELRRIAMFGNQKWTVDTNIDMYLKVVGDSATFVLNYYGNKHSVSYAGSLGTGTVVGGARVLAVMMWCARVLLENKDTVLSKTWRVPLFHYRHMNLDGLLYDTVIQFRDHGDEIELKGFQMSGEEFISHTVKLWLQSYYNRNAQKFFGNVALFYDSCMRAKKNVLQYPGVGILPLFQKGEYAVTIFDDMMRITLSQEPLMTVFCGAVSSCIAEHHVKPNDLVKLLTESEEAFLQRMAIKHDISFSKIKDIWECFKGIKE